MANRGSSGSTRREQKISAEERRRMIEEAAYFRAQARGFRSDPLDDWLAAEAEIDRRFITGDRSSQAAYERLRAEVEKGLAAIRGTVDSEAVQEAVERATERAKRAGQFATSSLNQAAERLRGEIADASRRMGPRWEAFSERTASVFEVWRDRGGAFLTRAAAGVGDWLEETGRRMDRRKANAGEAPGPGVFECAECGEMVQIESGQSLPPCPKCSHNEFKRLA